MAQGAAAVVGVAIPYACVVSRGPCLGNYGGRVSQAAEGVQLRAAVVCIAQGSREVARGGRVDGRGGDDVDILMCRARLHQSHYSEPLGQVTTFPRATCTERSPLQLQGKLYSSCLGLASLC